MVQHRQPQRLPPVDEACLHRNHQQGPSKANPPLSLSYYCHHSVSAVLVLTQAPCAWLNWLTLLPVWLLLRAAIVLWLRQLHHRLAPANRYVCNSYAELPANGATVMIAKRQHCFTHTKPCTGETHTTVSMCCLSFCHCPCASCSSWTAEASGQSRLFLVCVDCPFPIYNI